jgi:RNA polymerase sigma factor (sigma-70 family)
MPRDTDIGGPDGRFPTTHRSAVLGVRSQDALERERSFATLVSAYWKPVYKFIRIRWHKSNEDAKDLTQGFFVQVLEKEFLRSYDPARGRFRTFLRTCLEGFLSNEHKAAGRLKRGGEQVFLSLDFETAEGEFEQMEIASPENIERYFEEEWTRSLVGLAVSGLEMECRSQGRETTFLLFERYDLEEAPPEGRTYRELADEFGLKVTDVTNHLAWARREFRRILLRTLQEITASDEEFRLEARLLLGRSST